MLIPSLVEWLLSGNQAGRYGYPSIRRPSINDRPPSTKTLDLSGKISKISCTNKYVLQLGNRLNHIWPETWPIVRVRTMYFRVGRVTKYAWKLQITIQAEAPLLYR
jgi:hypothetical protein